MKKLLNSNVKLTFNGIHKSYENYDSYTFKQNEILMDKPLYLGFSVLELSKLHMYETYYDIFNHILEKKIFNYIIWIPIHLF